MRITPLPGVAVFFLALTLPAQNFPERPVSALAFFHNSEQETAAASDGTDFLIVGYRAGMIAHRVTAAGEVLDGAGIRIPPPRERLADLRLLGVFWGGDAYTIVWQVLVYPDEIPSPATPPDYRTQIARIDHDGRLIDGPRTILGSRFPLFGAASNGNRIVLVGDRLTILDARGDLLEPNLPLPSIFYGNRDHTVAWNGKGFMVSWVGTPAGDQQSYVNVAPLDGDGRPIGTFKSIASGSPVATMIASDGNDYVVVYLDATATSSDQTLHVSAAGDLLERHALPGLLQAQRSIIWSGGRYVVAAQAQNSTQLPSVLRLDRTGAAVDGGPVSISSTGALLTSNRMVTASNGRQVLLSWREGTETSGFRSFAEFLGSDGQPSGSAFPLGVTPTVQRSPQIALGGGVFMVVWQEGSDVYASRLTLAGDLLDGGIKLSSKPAASPRVVFDGQMYVVAWWSDTSIVTAHLSPTGTVLQGERAALPSCSGDFDMTTDGTTALVAGRDCGNRVSAARVHRDGIADPPIAVSPAAMRAGTPRVAWNGEHYLVVWRDLFEVPPSTLWSPPSYRGNIRAARLSASLTVLDPEPLSIAVSQTDDAFAPLLASNGSDFMVAWTAGALRARAVKSDGAIGDVTNVASGVGTGLVWDGRRYALAFVAANDVFVIRLGAGASSAIAASEDVESSGALAASGNGGLIAAYVREPSEQPYVGVGRVFVKGLVPQARSRAVR